MSPDHDPLAAFFSGFSPGLVSGYNRKQALREDERKRLLDVQEQDRKRALESEALLQRIKQTFALHDLSGRNLTPEELALGSDFLTSGDPVENIANLAQSEHGADIGERTYAPESVPGQADPVARMRRILSAQPREAPTVTAAKMRGTKPTDLSTRIKRWSDIVRGAKGLAGKYAPLSGPQHLAIAKGIETDLGRKLTRDEFEAIPAQAR